MSGGVATTADANYCGPRLKRKTKIIKNVKLYAGLKTATDIGVETARRVTVRTDRFPRTWVFWVINGFECAKVIVIE